jgi:hypothetical protein
MRAFVHLRRFIATNRNLARRLDRLEKKYDAQFKVVFDAIRQLMTPSEPRPKRIGFRVEEVYLCGHADRPDRRIGRGGWAARLFQHPSPPFGGEGEGEG